MKHWTIGQKITGGFGLLIFIMAGVTVFGIWQAQGIFSRAELNQQKILPAQAFITTALLGSQKNYALLLRYLANTTGGESAQELLSEIAVNKELIDKSLKGYEGTISTPQGRKLFQQLQRDRNDFVSIREHLFELKKAGDLSVPVLVESQFVPAAQKYNETCNQLLERRKEQSITMLDEIVETSRQMQRS